MGKPEVTLGKRGRNPLVNVLGFSSVEGINARERTPNVWRMQGRRDLEMQEGYTGIAWCNTPATQGWFIHGEHSKKPKNF